jgi:threonine-phosphate decarboxylase
MIELAPLHGGQLRQIADHFGIPGSELLDFSANVNPDGAPAAVHSVLCHALDEPSILMDYPDLDETELRQSLARYTNIRPDNVTVANGFVPLLDAALRILPVRKCLVPVPAFVEYRRVLERSKIEIVPHRLESSSNFSYEISDLVDGSHDSVLLANPQNPSGVLCSRETMLRIVEEAEQRNIFVLLDEAFIDYCPEASLAREADRFPNLIVFRSVTKFFGIAGLRVAYAVANIELCKRLQQAIAPWSVTSLASLAACAAVRDEAYARQTIALNNERRDQIQIAIGNLGIHVYPSAANFLLLCLASSIDSQQFWQHLIREHRIVLRNCTNYEALNNRYLRAAVRTDAENARLIEAFAHEVENRQ